LFQDIAYFLISTVFSLYIAVVVIRLLLGLARADFYNPISQQLVKLTNPPLVILRRFIPSIGKVDTSAIVLAYGLMFVKVSLLYLVARGAVMFPESILIAFGEFLRIIVMVYIIALIVQAIISWVGSAHGNPVAPLVHSLVNPIVRPIQKIVPTIGMIDLSPMVAILGLQVILIVIDNTLPAF